MKRLEVTATSDDSKKVEDALSSLDILYTRHKNEVGKETCTTFSAVLPDEMVESVLTQVAKSLDMRRKENMVTVYNLVASVSPYLDRLDEKARQSAPGPNPMEAIAQPLNKFLEINLDRAVMVALASIIALVGLFLNNVAIVIGAMLLSPLLGPINAASLNAILGRARQLIQAEEIIVGSVLIAVGVAFAATATASIFVDLELTEQILIRSDVSVLDVLIAILLGIAGGIALVVALPEILVGVAVAVALLPPATVSGAGLALGRVDIFSGALVLTMINLVGLQVGGILVLRLKGISPRRYYEKERARTYGSYSLAIFSVILFVLLLLVMLVRLGLA